MPACVNPEHLEAVTPAENVRRGRRAKLTAEQVAEIRASADTQMVLARRYGISQPQVSRIKRGQTWRGAPVSRVSPPSAGALASSCPRPV
jgi:hypothetical protein